MTTTPPGWYDDGHGAVRWWDGAQWTEHTRVPDTASAVPSATFPPEPTPLQPRKSNRWIIWVAVGVLALGIVISAVIYLPMLIVGAVENSAQPSADEQAAVDAVHLYDDAWDEVDCDKYMQATTESFRELEQMTDCATFEDTASTFAESTDDYNIEVTDITHDGETIVVTTTETYQTMIDDSGAPLDEPQQAEDHYSYVLVPVDEGWAIDDADSD